LHLVFDVISLISKIITCDNHDNHDYHDYHDKHDNHDKHMPKREIKPIFVRLTEAERRRIKTLAVSQGLTMREAIVQAFEAWASQLRSGVFPSGPKPKRRRQPEHASIGQQLRGPAGTRPSEVGPSLADVPGLEALTGDWVGRAAQLDWSKCPAAECVQTKKGNVWVASGTLVPLVHIFDAVAGDNPLPEIAEVYDLTLQQLMALLQFAAGVAAPAAAGR
jgi:hypothetical protein